MKRFNVVLFSTLLLWGCTTDLLDTENSATAYDPSKVVTFSTGPIKRGTPITSVTQMTDMGVFAAHTGQNDWTNSDAPNKMYNRQLNRNSVAGGWEYEGVPEQWDSNVATDKFTFFAYAPFASADNGIVMVSTASTGGTPKLSYTAPTDVLKQPDLMVAVPRKDVYKTNHAVSLEMKHALTSIGFQVMGNGEKIKSLSISGISVSAQLAIDGGNIAWTNHTPVTNVDFSASINYDTGQDYYTTTPILSTNLMKGDGYLMMIPQTLGDDAVLKVTYDDGTFTSISLKDNQWLAGKKMTYNIFGDRLLIVTEPAAFTYKGGSQDISITSTLTSVSGTIEPVAWTAEFSTDNGSTWSSTPPTWLSSFPTSGIGGQASIYKTTVEHQPFTPTSPEDVILRNATVRGSHSAPYDLSTLGGSSTQSTANSYIINAPGYYQLPLVYGNAIKNGSQNPNAYTSVLSESSTNLKYFKTHLGTNVQNPYLYNHVGVVPDNAVVLWQSSYELVSSLQLDAAKQNLKFELKRDRILQGNALVAVRDASNQILWSWHIWVTPLVDPVYPTTDVVVNFQNKTYHFMQYNLGWMTNSRINYSDLQSRMVKIKITQTGVTSPASKVFVISQDAATIENNFGIGLYWQWGRKDPFMPIQNYANRDLYFDDMNYQLSSITGEVDLATGIRNPVKFYTPSSGYSNWTKTAYANLWSANSNSQSANDNPNVKTIYDPSPRGFKMPPSNAWTGFSKNGTYGTGNEINASGGYGNGNSYGWNFYLINETGNTSYYPATAYLDGNMKVANLPLDGQYWSAVSYTGSYLTAYSLGFSSFYVFTTSPNFHRYYGVAVRPIRE